MNVVLIRGMIVLGLTAFSLRCFGQEVESLATSDRDVPIIGQVDVLVLGGSTGAVAAAQEAAKSGAKTMLLTEYPYLGEDMTATFHLWDDTTEEKSDPLLSEIMDDPINKTPLDGELWALLKYPRKIPFKYSVLQDINPNHPETSRNDRLNDGLAFSVRTQSLQVDGDADVVLDFGESKKIGTVSLIAFYRPKHFAVEKAVFSRSDNGSDWTLLESVHRDHRQFPQPDTAIPYTLRFREPIETRFLKITARLEGDSRIALLGEIVAMGNGNATDGKVDPQTTHREYPRPLHVKRVLDKTLSDAGVEFLYGTYVTGIVRNSKGEIRGATITSRSGRQAVLAKTVVDARLDYGELIDTWSEGENVRVGCVVIGGRAVPIEERLKAHDFRLLKNGRCDVMENSYFSYWPNPAQTDGGEFQVFRYTFEIERDDAERICRGDMLLYGRLETEMRRAVYHHDMQFVADRMVVLPGPVQPKQRKLGNRSGNDAILVGRVIGQNAARTVSASRIENPETLRTEVASRPVVSRSAVAGDVRELLDGMRSYDPPLGYVHESGWRLPVVASYDVVVVGGGTTGAPAAIAAARAGAKTLVVDYQHALGGVGTVGAIAGFYWGNRVGFTGEIAQGHKSWNTVRKSRQWLEKLGEAGGDAWFGVLGAGAFVNAKPDANGRAVVRGVLIATPFGPQVVRAKVVIDTTGGGDIARSAGAEMEFVTENEITVQGTGLPPLVLGGRYRNNDYTYIDDTDPIDATHAYVYAKEKFSQAFDLGKMLNTRERRRVVGEFTITLLDQLNGRTYPDSIARSFSNFDTHGYTIDPYLDIAHPKKVGIYTYYPYRSSIPKRLDGVLVGALATSCHRDALPLIRMQADLQNQGYGLGYAAATAVRNGVSVREVDVREVQRHLVEIGNLPESVLEETDNYEASRSGLEEAVRSIPDDYDGLALAMWHPEEALPLLRNAYSGATDPKAKFAYAKVLAGLGDPTGEETLLESLQSTPEWDDGWNFKAMSQFGMASSALDQTIMMLGRIKSRKAVPSIVEKLNRLRKEDAFSHHRACFLALERIGDASAAPALADHLNKPDMTGYVHDSLQTAVRRDREDPNVALGEKSRRDSLIEIGAARALYRLGDVDGQGRRVLEAYRKDLRGHFARHAAELLHQKP